LLHFTPYSQRGDLRFVAAGGDGTVSWVAELVTEACQVNPQTHSPQPSQPLTLNPEP